MGGGIYSEGYLRHGDSWEIKLPIGDYIQVDEPGVYTGQIFYHNEVTIADIKDPNILGELLLIQSDPFEFTVTKGPMITVQLTRVEHAKAKKFIDDLNTSELKIVLGTYSKAFHGFVDPISAQGKLLSLGWAAVPALIERLEDGELSFEKRAHIISLLYSITCEERLNPFNLDILPSHRWKSVSGHGSLSNATHFDHDAQNQNADSWIEFRDSYMQIAYKDSIEINTDAR